MNRSKRLFYVSATLVLLALPFVVYFKAQAITDWWQLRGYTPPQAVVSLTTQDTMTPYARHVFYVNHPQVVQDVTLFRQDCSEAEQTIVLGCYRSDQNGVFVYDVKDPLLDGVEQVTAAHETLHAIYDRLSSSEKDYVDGLLQNYYNSGSLDQRIKDEIDSYKKTEPNDLVNEMHSIFGTEVTNLPAPLESYYGRYFTDRSAVVDFANSYQSEFTSRQNQINAADAQLSTLKQQIDSEETALTVQSQQINTDRSALNSQKSAGQIDTYNAGVDSFNAAVDTYNTGVAKLHYEISAYNGLVNQRNLVAADLANLDKAIDTRLTTQASQ